MINLIKQTNRTVLFDEVNPEKLNLLTLIGDSREKDSLDDETIKVINRCTNILTNEKKEALGRAYAVDNTNSKLKVSFFRPFYGDYWIIIYYNRCTIGSNFNTNGDFTFSRV